MIDFDGKRENLTIAEIVALAVTRGKQLDDLWQVIALHEEELDEYKQQISTLQDEIKALEVKK